MRTCKLTPQLGEFSGVGTLASWSRTPHRVPLRTCTTACSNVFANYVRIVHQFDLIDSGRFNWQAYSAPVCTPFALRLVPREELEKVEREWKEAESKAALAEMCAAEAEAKLEGLLEALDVEVSVRGTS